MEALAKVLGEHPFLQEIDKARLDPLVACASKATFPAGSFVFREGAPATALYLLQQGRVMLEISVPARGTARVETLDGGDILGLSWLFPPYRWQADARVVEAATAIAFEASCLRERLDQDPVLGYAVMKSLAHQLYLRLERVRLQRLDVYKAEP